MRRSDGSISASKRWAEAHPARGTPFRQRQKCSGAVLTANRSAPEPNLFAVETAPTNRFTQRRRRAGGTRRGISAHHRAGPRKVRRSIEGRFYQYLARGTPVRKTEVPVGAVLTANSLHRAQFVRGRDRSHKALERTTTFRPCARIPTSASSRRYRRSCSRCRGRRRPDECSSPWCRPSLPAMIL